MTPPKAIRETAHQPDSFPSSVISQVLQAIAGEIGVHVNQLTDEANFMDFGVDSLMSLTLLGTFRESFNLDLPPSIFEDCPTVKSLKDCIVLAQSESSSGQDSSSTDDEYSGGSSPPFSDRISEPTTATIASSSASEADVDTDLLGNKTETTIRLLLGNTGK